MVRLVYIFWAAALFLLGGCNQTPAVRVHRPEINRQETATYSPAGLIFSPPEMRPYELSGFGQDQVAGINLNSRMIRQSANGWYDHGEGVYYRLRYYDRHPDRRADDGFLSRSFLYYQEGMKSR